MDDPYDNLFEVNDFAYVVEKAKKGVLERICIKKINEVSEIYYNYQDTFNRLWLEPELCDLEAAEEYVSNSGVE